MSTNNRVETTTGKNDQPIVLLLGENGSSVEIYLNGATLTSFKNGKGEDLLFVSSLSNFETGKAIRGGIPICWPQFGPGALPQHGFARNSLWTVKSTHSDDSSVTVVLSLDDSEQTRSSAWPHQFHLEYTVQLVLHPNQPGTEQLKCSLAVFNKDKESFTFTTALHSYLRVPNIQHVEVIGLNGVSFRDKLVSPPADPWSTESREVVTVPAATDRVYADVKTNPVVIRRGEGVASVVDRTSQLEDCVLWNPYNTLGDLGESDWPKFVCLEPARVINPVVLAPGDRWEAGLTISSKL